MEVADLVQATLEKNGTFSLLKAQLRASVQRVIQGGEEPAANPAVARLAETDPGTQALLLIREALECLGLEQTLATLSAECGNQMPEMDSKPTGLARKLNVNFVAGEPVLLSVLRGRSERGHGVARESPPLQEANDIDEIAVEKTRQSTGGARVVNVQSAEPVEPEPEPEPVPPAIQAKVARLGQGAITRSTAGWDVKADDYTDDFMDDDSTAGPETHHGDDVARAEGKTEAATDGLKVSDWDDASDDFDSSLDAGRLGALLPSGAGMSKLPSLENAEVNEATGGSRRGWGAVGHVDPVSAPSGGSPYDNDSSGYSIEEALSDHPEEKAELSRDSDLDNSYSNPKTDANVILPAAPVVEKRSNQEDDSYGNDFSMESTEPAAAPEEKNSVKADDDYEVDDYEQDDFEFEEDNSSFHVDAKNEDKSMSSDGSSVFGGRTQKADAEESARLDEVNRKLAALEEADGSLKSLKESPKAKPANDFEVDEYDSIDEILSDSVSSDDGLSVGGADSASDSFLNESDSRGFMADSRGSATAKSRQSGPGRTANTSSNNSLASSIEFSVTEHEVSGSNAGLDDVDFSAKALPPVRGKRAGW